MKVPTKVRITPTSVKFDDGEEPQPPWIEDEISEVTIVNAAGREFKWYFGTEPPVPANPEGSVERDSDDTNTGGIELPETD